MFDVIQDGKDIAATAERFGALLKRDATILTKKLSVPGGEGNFGAQPLHQLNDKGLWSWQREGRERYTFWFGTDSGKSEPFAPSIEINFAKKPRSKSLAGRILRDINGNVWIAHRGGLGGGRASVKIDDFALLIDGFSRESALWTGDDRSKEELLYVIGGIESDLLVSRLDGYVREAERIRELKRNEKAFSTELIRKERNFPLVTPGSLTGGKSDRAGGEMSRTHGFVLKSLVKTLRSLRRGTGPEILLSNQKTEHGRPDLCVLGASNVTTHLFEIKTGIDTQSLYTALGQLLVYGSGVPELSPEVGDGLIVQAAAVAA